MFSALKNTVKIIIDTKRNIVTTYEVSIYLWTENTTVIFFLWPYSPELDSVKFQVSDETTK